MAEPMRAFEASLWAQADKLRNTMDAAEHKHIVLGLNFLKYFSDAFEEKLTSLRDLLLAHLGQNPVEVRREAVGGPMIPHTSGCRV